MEQVGVGSAHSSRWLEKVSEAHRCQEGTCALEAQNFIKSVEKRLLLRKRKKLKFWLRTANLAGFGVDFFSSNEVSTGHFSFSFRFGKVSEEEGGSQ